MRVCILPKKGQKCLTALQEDPARFSLARYHGQEGEAAVYQLPPAHLAALTELAERHGCHLFVVPPGDRSPDEEYEPHRVFLRAEREAIKSRSMLPSDTLAYIETLEEIARAALAYWTYSSRQTERHQACSDRLYDALAWVNFLNETP